MSKSAVPSKLFKLKKWLTLAETAKHLSGVCGEEVVEADILRLALDGHLTLSVNFVNHAYVRIGKVVGYEDVIWDEFPAEIADSFFNFPAEFKGKPVQYISSKKIDDDRYLNLDSEVKTIDGVWDLPLIGGERLDIEHKYQWLTGGPEITLQCLEGALVEGRDGVMCQLQVHFEDNEYQPGSNANLKKLAENLNSNDLDTETVSKLLAQSRIDRAKYIEAKKSRPDYENYYPAGGLPADSVFVVRTEALRAFEQLISDVENENTDNCIKSNGHKERHAQNREQVLGAAFAVLAKWPNECKDAKGDPVASKIASLVETKANLFWSDSIPPLTVDSIADHLRDWIKKANSRK